MIKIQEQSLDDLMKEEELWWAKINSLQVGDKNSKYFHIKASQRRRKNTINQIQDDNGNTWSDNDRMSSTFMEYFSKIFTSSNPLDMQDTIDVVKDRINNDIITISKKISVQKKCLKQSIK